MKLVKYNQFVGLNIINENLDKSKKFLKERYLLMKAAEELGLLNGELGEQIKHGEKRSANLSDFTPEQQGLLKNKIREISLTPDIVKKIEADPGLKLVRELKTDVVSNGKTKTYQLDRDNMGWLSNFVYFYIFENASLEDLSVVYGRLIQCKSVLQNLTIDVNGTITKKQFDPNFVDILAPNNLEKLTDGLDRLDRSRKVKRISDKLSISSELKAAFAGISEMNMIKFEEIAEGFDRLSDKEVEAFFGSVQLDTFQYKMVNGQLSDIPNPLYNTYHFMSTLPRYHNMDDFLKAAKQYLDSIELSSIESIEGESEADKKVRITRKRFLDFCDKVVACNTKLGKSGADIVYPQNIWDTDVNKNGILIVEVKSFPANVMLNAHTNHCTKDSIGNWDSYVANHSNKQYYIYDFNRPLTDDFSTIGITIEPGQRQRACHNRSDRSVSNSDFKALLKTFEKTHGIKEDLWSYFKPMSEDEISMKEKAKLANRRIVEKGLSIDDIKKYVMEHGADINKDNGACLENAVIEDDIEKVKVILSLGALTTLKSKEKGPLVYAKDIDMIKLLVSHGAEMTGEVFKNVINNEDSLQYCLSAGLDPAFGINLPLRDAIKGTWTKLDPNNPESEGEAYFKSFLLLMKYIEKDKTHMQNFKTKFSFILRWAIEFARFDCLDYFNNLGLLDNIAEVEWDDILLCIKISRKRNRDAKIATLKWIEENTGRKPKNYTIEDIVEKGKK